MWLNVSKCVQMCLNVSKCEQTWANMCKCVRMLVNLCECVWMCVNVCLCVWNSMTHLHIIHKNKHLHTVLNRLSCVSHIECLIKCLILLVSHCLCLIMWVFVIVCFCVYNIDLLTIIKRLSDKQLKKRKKTSYFF